MEAIVMFVMGIWFSYFAILPGLIGLVIAGVIAEYNEESGFASIFLILAAISAFFVFGITLEMVAMYSIAYFAIGFVWSFWRYRKFVAKQVVEICNKYSAPDNTYHVTEKHNRLDALKPSNNVDLIVYWVWVWPFSMIENLTADLMHIVSTMVTSTFKNIYNKIYTNAIANVK